MPKLRSVKLTDKTDQEKVRQFFDVKKELETRGAVLVAEIQQRIETVQKQNQEAIEAFNKEHHERLFAIWREVVGAHFPEADLEAAFKSGSHYLEMSFYEDHGDAYVCTFMEKDAKEPNVAPEKVTIH